MDTDNGMRECVLANLRPGSGWGDQDPLGQAMIQDRAWMVLADYCEEIFTDPVEGRCYAAALRQLAEEGVI